MGDSYTSQGDNSQNVSGKNVRIENMNLINAPSSGGGGEPPIKVERSLIIKLPFSVNQLLFGGLIGSIFGVAHKEIKGWSDPSGFLFSIASSIPSWVPPSVLITSLILFMIGLVFKHASYFLGKSWLGAFERSANGGIYFTRVKGTCPHCSHSMRMLYGTKDNPLDRLICKRSPNHHGTFDMTILPDVAEDYARWRSGGTANPGGGGDTSAHDDDTAAREECVKEIENV